MATREALRSEGVRLGASALGLALLVVGSSGAWAAPASGVELDAGLIVDPARSVVFVMGAKSGVEALDLSSGRIAWTSMNAAKPLALGGNLLVAQAEPNGDGALRIAVLDTAANGKIVLETWVDLPQGVRASVDDGLGTSFRAKVDFQDKGSFVVSWVFTRLAMTPVASRRPQPDQGPRAGEGPRETRGAARVDVASGRVDQVGVPPEPTLPATVGRLLSSGKLPEMPFRAGGMILANQRQRDDAGERLIVHRWDAATGAALPDLFFTGADDMAAHFASADGRHLLVSGRGGVDASTAKPYVWFIVSTQTGQRVAQFQTHVGAARFYFQGSQLLFKEQPYGHGDDANWIDEPMRLRAVDLSSGADLWQHPIRDTEYRGPFPPS